MKLLPIAFSLFCALLLCSCEQEAAKMDSLPEQSFPSRTSSTYTGTTVDYIYSSTARQPNSNDFDMPEMPDFSEIDNMFDEDFFELFTDSIQADMPEFVSIENTPQDFPEVSADFAENIETVTVPASIESVEFGDFDIAMVSENVQTDTADITQINNPTQTMPPTEQAATLDNTDTFNISDYMPSENDYPDFTAEFTAAD